jgi:hypothetical protein
MTLRSLRQTPLRRRSLILAIASVKAAEFRKEATVPPDD